VDIGFVGLGHIGGAIAANLVADGHAVSVRDVDGAKQATLVEAGAHGSESIAGVAERSEVTFLSLPTPAIMEQVTLEWLDAAAPGAVLVDLTTNAPATVRELGGRVVASGREFLECPLTGGAPGARMRMLVFICGGEASTYERVGPLLDALGRARFHLGPLGCGNVGKLVNSLMAFTATWVSLEGLAIGARHDIDLRTLVDMMRTAGATNFFIERMVEGINERGRPPEFALDLAAKDAGLLLDVARDVAVPAPVAGDIAQVMVLAKSMGLGGRDFTDLVEVMERVAGVTLSLPPSA
jgi:3-hydroxyisobutyrate dehydrogenase-like beta-hydroxyacid dehydrogenase